MPTLKQASNANMKGWQPVPAPPPQAVQKPTLPNPLNNPQRLPTMLSSMPLMASTADAFIRQFYGGTNVPKYRILPAGGGA
jgi:hypothetical protein